MSNCKKVKHPYRVHVRYSWHIIFAHYSTVNENCDFLLYAYEIFLLL